MSCDFMEGNYSPFCLIFRPCLLWHRSLVSLSFHFTLSVSLLVSQRTRCKSSSSKCPTYVSLKVFVSLISLTFLMWKNNNSVAWHLKMYGPPSEESCAECARTNQVEVSQAGSPRAWHSWLLQGCGEHRAGGIDILLCYLCARPNATKFHWPDGSQTFTVSWFKSLEDREIRELAELFSSRPFSWMATVTLLCLHIMLSLNGSDLPVITRPW